MSNIVSNYTYSFGQEIWNKSKNPLFILLVFICFTFGIIIIGLAIDYFQNQINDIYNNSTKNSKYRDKLSVVWRSITMVGITGIYYIMVQTFVNPDTIDILTIICAMHIIIGGLYLSYVVLISRYTITYDHPRHYFIFISIVFGSIILFIKHLKQKLVEDTDSFPIIEVIYLVGILLHIVATMMVTYVAKYEKKGGNAALSGGLISSCSKNSTRQPDSKQKKKTTATLRPSTLIGRQLLGLGRMCLIDLLIGIHVVFAIVYFFHTIMLCDNTE